MSLFSAGRAHDVTLEPDALASSPAPPGYSRVLLVAAAEALDFAIVTAIGVALYHVHVVQQIGSQPVYYLLSSGVALICTIAFYLLQSYSVPALRRPINQLFRKMPYEYLAGVHISGEEIYAAAPNWLETSTEGHPEGDAGTTLAGEPA